jgi:UDP-N-acetylmuramate dehydrogenase
MNMTEPTQFIAEGLRGTLRCDVDMRRHTSWRAGGHVERTYRPADLADLAMFLRTLPADEPVLAVGLGSNLLVRDGGMRGTALMLHAALSELRIEADGSVYVQAGIAGAKLRRRVFRRHSRHRGRHAGDECRLLRQ